MPPIDRLRAAAESGDEATIRRVLGPLSEADRAEVAALAREIMAATVARGIDAARQLGPMLLLAYGVLPVTELRKLGWRSNHLPPGTADVLRGRSPERLGPIVDYLMDGEGGPREWRTVRQLVREGIIPRPDSPGYTIGMLRLGAYRPAAELVEQDPGLLDVEVWRLFEVEGGGEDSLANYEKFHRDGWGDVFRSMAAADPAARERLLDASLAALARDFSQYRAGWFSRFHESLKPSDAERARRVEAYLGLLRSRVGPTVSFAVAALARVERAGSLPGPALLGRIGPVLSEGAAGTAKAGLDLVARSAARSPGNADRAAAVASAGLRHPSSDVQKAALAVIGRLAATPDAELAALLAKQLPEVAASQRPALTALVERLGGVDAPSSPVVEAAPSSSAPVAVRSPLDASRAISPVPTLEALVDLAVSVLETGEPADDIERVLDGVRRFADVRSGDASRLVAPIAKRARTLLGRRDSMPFNGFDAQADVAAVLLAWTTGEVVASAPARRTIDAGAGAFLSARAREVAQDAARGQAGPTVALPTHRGGWIEPGALVERLATSRPASSLDLVAAVLRLAAEGRREALGAAGGLRGEVGAVVRYALGGEESIGPTAAWWVAAARVRSPGLDDEVVDRRHSRLGPEAARAATIALRITRPKGTYERLALGVQPPPTARVGADIPTALMLRNTSAWYWSGRSDPAMFRWTATIQPAYREVWAAVGSLLIGANVDWWSADWANRAFLEPFLEPWSALGPHALTLLGIALGAKEAGERGLATDVGRLAIADGRLDAAGLGRGLAAATAVQLDRPQRWALSLADVAADSDRHAAAVAAGIAGALPSVVARPPGRLVPLLRLLDELLAQTRGRPSVEARPPIEALSRSGGQAGRLARSILARAG